MSIKKSLEKYPCIGSVYKQNPRKQKKCDFCSDRAEFRLDIQTWWNRGDDEVMYTCVSHKPKNKEEIEALWKKN